MSDQVNEKVEKLVQGARKDSVKNWIVSAATITGLIAVGLQTFLSTQALGASVEDVKGRTQRIEADVGNDVLALERRLVEQLNSGIAEAGQAAKERELEATQTAFDRFWEEKSSSLVALRADIEQTAAQMSSRLRESEERSRDLAMAVANVEAQLKQQSQLIGLTETLQKKSSEDQQIALEAKHETTKREFAFLLDESRWQPYAYNGGTLWGEVGDAPSSAVRLKALNQSGAFNRLANFRQMLDELNSTDRVPPSLPPKDSDEYFTASERLYVRMKKFAPFWVEFGLMPKD